MNISGVICCQMQLVSSTTLKGAFSQQNSINPQTSATPTEKGCTSVIEPIQNRSVEAGSPAESGQFRLALRDACGMLKITAAILVCFVHRQGENVSQ